MADKERKNITLYSYRKVWKVEKKIYALQNIVLPVPVNPYEVLEFIAVVVVVLILSNIFPFLQNVPPVLRYGAIPFLVVKYLMKLKLDGKNPIKYFMGLIPYLFTRNLYQEHFASHVDRKEKIKLKWLCSKG